MVGAKKFYEQNWDTRDSVSGVIETKQRGETVLEWY